MMKLNNIKASFIFENNVVNNGSRQIIWKSGNFTFTIYEHTPKLINITGVKSAIEMEQQKSLIEKKFKQKVLKVRIDNTFFSKGRFFRHSCRMYPRCEQNIVLNFICI